MLRFLLLLVLMAVLTAQDRALVPAGGRRVALVIGNNAYRAERLALVAAAPDAKAVAAALPGLGFEPKNIFAAYDADLRAIQRTVRAFVSALGRGDTAFVYYAGHGVEVRGKNYLLPVDIRPEVSELEVMDEAYSAQDLLEKIETSGAQARIVILDACRNNPLKTRSMGRGLAQMNGSGTLIVFPTAAGQVTPDNGLFRRELLKGLSEPGVAADDAFKRIGRAVYRASNKEQTPAIYGLLLEDFAFVPGRVGEPPPVVGRGPQAGDVRVGKDGLRYVFVPPGTFQMGCSDGDSECYDDEKPAPDIQITRGFWMGQTEVTVEAYKRFAAATRRKMPEEPVWNGRKLNGGWSNGSMPMVMVDWNDTKAYCGWAGMRLPTEAEWEYAARGGTRGKYYGGTLSELAWFADNSGKATLDSAKLWGDFRTEYRNRLSANGNGFHPVGLKAPNGFGLYDMLGNVWEWTEDWYGNNYYQVPDRRDPQGPPKGEVRVLRGGSWYEDPRSVRASRHIGFPPSVRNDVFGLRCVGE